MRAKHTRSQAKSYDFRLESIRRQGRVIKNGGEGGTKNRNVVEPAIYFVFVDGSHGGNGILTRSNACPVVVAVVSERKRMTTGGEGATERATVARGADERVGAIARASELA